MLPVGPVVVPRKEVVVVVGCVGIIDALERRELESRCRYKLLSPTDRGAPSFLPSNLWKIRKEKKKKKKDERPS